MSRADDLRSLGLDPIEVDRQMIWLQRVAPIVEAVLMGDRGFATCVCSDAGKCYLHAQQERATSALESVREDVFALAKAARLLLALWGENEEWLGSDWTAFGEVIYGLKYALDAFWTEAANSHSRSES